MKGTIIVLNQFALPRDQGGGTRHTDLFRRVSDFRHVIVAGDRNHYTQARYTTSDPTFRLVRLPAAGATGTSRIRAWLTYASKALVRSLSERDLAAVFASTPHLLVPVVGLVAARARRVPFILEVRDIWPDSLVSAGAIAEDSLIYKLLKRVEIGLVRNADAVVGVVPEWDSYFESLGLPSAKYWGVSNGADLNDFTPSDERDTLRRNYGITGFTAVFAGAHGPKDGIRQILDAARELPDVTFLFVGAGSQKLEAQRRVHDEDLHNVNFRDTVSKQELPDLLAACDVGIHAVSPLPIFELGMSPNKLFDYLAAGLPIVSNAAGPLSGVLRADECGPMGGPDDLAHVLRAVRDADESTRERWRASGGRLISERFSRTMAARNMTRAIECALAQRRRGHRAK